MSEDNLVATLEADVATLEGAFVECVRVRKNADGICKCAGYGPKGSEPGLFKRLCREAGAKIRVGTKDFYTSGGDKMALALPAPMDYAPIEGFDDDLGFFERVIDERMYKPALVVLGGGAIGGAAYSALAGLKVNGSVYFDKSWKKMLLATGLGLLGGRALWGEPNESDDSPNVAMRRNLAKGHLGAMGYVLGGELVSMLKSASSSTSTAGIGRFLPRSSSHAQLRDPQVETKNPAFAEVDIESENQLAGIDVSSWIS